jgi:hypothetical protein
MCCKARPTGTVAAIALVVFVVFARSIGHFFGEAALFVAIAVATAVAALAAAFALAAFLGARRKQPRLQVVRTPERVPAGPRWPDRPILRAEAVSRPAPGPTDRHAGQKERARSTALSFASGAGDPSGASVRCPRKGNRIVRVRCGGPPASRAAVSEGLRAAMDTALALRQHAGLLAISADAVTTARPDPSGV